MKIYDISMAISPGMPVYKGKPDKKPALSETRFGGVCETTLTLNLHTGTHADAPRHLEGLEGTVADYPPEMFVCRCRVIDLSGAKDAVSARDLSAKRFRKGEFLLLKTRNSFSEMPETDFVFLDASGAAYLKRRGVKGVGIDAPGIERGSPGHDTHAILFKAGIAILEGLRLGEVPEGMYLLSAAPLIIKGAEAGPVRAILIS